MRLSTTEIQAIKAAARDTFGEDAVVRLFGSRVHDHLKGGDIDLHVELASLDDNEWALKDKFRDALFSRIEPRRVDVLIAQRESPPTPIEAIAIRDGVIL